jgi:glycosyltransferase involved in cell wall biosynthesis
VAGIVYGVGRGLEQRGHHVDYLFTGDLPTSSYVPGRFKELEFAIELARLIGRDPTRYSVVNLHAPAGCAYGVLRYLSPRIRKNGPAYVMTLHGLEERRIYSMKREAKKGKAFHFSFKNRLWHRIYHLPRFYFSIKTADHALCVGREVWTMVQLKYDLDTDQVSYSPTGVEERFFIGREYSQAASTRLLSVGTWLDQRGIYYLRDALRNLATRLPGLRLTIAGCGSDVDTIKNFFDPELRPLLDVISMVPYDQMPSLFAENDIFVLPSLMEGMSLALQEAMASGMAVITTETCGMIDSVENDFNGLLIPPADSNALENAILKLSQNPDLRARLGKAAQDTIRRRFTWARTIDVAESACASALRRVGRESEIQTEPPTRAANATVAEHF